MTGDTNHLLDHLSSIRVEDEEGDAILDIEIVPEMVSYDHVVHGMRSGHPVGSRATTMIITDGGDVVRGQIVSQLAVQQESHE